MYCAAEKIIIKKYRKYTNIPKILTVKKMLFVSDISTLLIRLYKPAITDLFLHLTSK